MTTHNWIDLTQDADTGIETLRAHFKGHAYDPHWHDSYLVGVTEQGVQQFNCRRARHQSTPGKVFLLEPGDIHDGEAPTEDGFTYRMLYLDPQWLERELSALFEDAPLNSQLSFATTLASDTRLAHAISLAFEALHGAELRIVRQSALDGLLERLTTHLHWRTRYAEDPRLPRVAQKAREYLHANARYDIGLDQLAAATGVDRFRLTRAFKAAYGISPCLPRAITLGHRASPAGPRRTTGHNRHGIGVFRSKSSGPLVCKSLWPDTRAVPQALLKSSRRVIQAL